MARTCFDIHPRRPFWRWTNELLLTIAVLPGCSISRFGSASQKDTYSMKLRASRRRCCPHSVHRCRPRPGELSTSPRLRPHQQLDGRHRLLRLPWPRNHLSPACFMASTSAATTTSFTPEFNVGIDVRDVITHGNNAGLKAWSAPASPQVPRKDHFRSGLRRRLDARMPPTTR